MTGFWSRARALWQEMRAASNEQRLLEDDYDEQRFAERKERHDAGIFEPPHPGGAG